MKLVKNINENKQNTKNISEEDAENAIKTIIESLQALIVTLCQLESNILSSSMKK